MYRFISLIAGVLFGIGMSVSGMIDPANVIAFLDVSGNWAPDLGFVMAGALLVYMPMYFLVIKPRKQPVLVEQFSLAKSSKVDTRLISGSVLFGLGWGLAGICPGPAVSSLLLGNAGIVIFFAFMMVGLAGTNLLICINKNNVANAKTASSN